MEIKNKYYLIIGVIVIIGGIFFFFPHYRINSSSHGTSVKKQSLTNQINSTYRWVFNRVFKKSSPQTNGIMAPGNCATQHIEMDLTGGELAEILNKAKPISVLLYDIRIEAHEEKITASATSAYPFLPGTLSGVGTLQGTNLSILEVYDGLVPIPQPLLSSIEKKANSYFIDLLIDYGFKLTNVQVRNGRINISAFVCPGLIQKDIQGSWKVDTTAVRPQIDDDSSMRY